MDSTPNSESQKSTSTLVLLVHILPFFAYTRIESCCLRIPGESPDLPSSLSKTIVEPQASAQPGVAHFCVWRNLDIVSSMSTTAARPNHLAAGQHESLRNDIRLSGNDPCSLFRQVKTRCHAIPTRVDTALNVLPPYQTFNQGHQKMSCHEQISMTGAELLDTRPTGFKTWTISNRSRSWFPGAMPCFLQWHAYLRGEPLPVRGLITANLCTKEISSKVIFMMAYSWA
jgi:hypothetical protein